MTINPISFTEVNYMQHNGIQVEKYLKIPIIDRSSVVLKNMHTLGRNLMLHETIIY